MSSASSEDCSSAQQSTRPSLTSDDRRLKDDGGRRPPISSSKNTLWLVFYVFVMHGIGSFIISGGLEFAIAYGMYQTSSHPVRLWRLPNTLSGDAAVTIFAQSVITWLIEAIVVDLDKRNGKAPSIPVFKAPNSVLVRWFFDLEAKLVKRTSPRKTTAMAAKAFSFFIENAVRALACSVPVFLVFWPVAVGILAGIGNKRGNDYYYDHYPFPQLYKFVFGGVLGFVITPAFASIRLLRGQWLQNGQLDNRNTSSV